jgi:hypothetical protein
MLSERAQAGEAPAITPSADNTLSKETSVFTPTAEGARNDYRHHAPRQTGTELRFRIDQVLDHIVINVLRPDKGELIREIVVGKLSSVTPGPTGIETGQLIDAIT